MTKTRIDPAKIFKTLSDETRLRILWLLDEHELSVNDMVEILGSTQSRVSRHLTVLKDSAFLECRREGTWVYYRKPEAEETAPEIAEAWRWVAECSKREPEAKQDRKRMREVLQRNRLLSRQFFGRHAAHWDAIRARLCGEFVTLQALESLIPPNLTVLDIGTGTGYFLLPLAKVTAKVIGVDHSPQMLELARRNARTAGLQNVELRVGEIDDLPLRDAEVDAVFAGLVLHHAPDPAKVILEMARVVKPGGTVTVIDLQRHAEEWMREELADAWLGFAEEDMRRWFTKAGLANLRWLEGLPPSVEGEKNAKSLPVKSFVIYGWKRENRD